MSRLIVVVPLKDGGRAKAEKLLEQGPPFEIEGTHLERHEVFLSRPRGHLRFRDARYRAPD